MSTEPDDSLPVSLPAVDGIRRQAVRGNLVGASLIRHVPARSLPHPARVTTRTVATTRVLLHQGLSGVRDR